MASICSDNDDVVDDVLVEATPNAFVADSMLLLLLLDDLAFTKTACVPTLNCGWQVFKNTS